MKVAVRFLAVVLLMTASLAWATDVTFKVNMSFQEDLGNFNPTTDIVVVRGNFNGWAGNANELTDQGEGIYAGTWDVVTGDETPPDTALYKFVMVTGTGDAWEGDPNREAVYETDPLVLDVVWFNRQEPVETTDLEVLFRVDMGVEILFERFDPLVDIVIIRGSHPNIGSWGGETLLTEETGNPGVYSSWIQFDDLPIPTPVEYKFVKVLGGSGGDVRWEDRPNRSFIPTGDEPDNLPPGGNGYGEIMPGIVYFGDVGPDDIITEDLNVLFRVEVTPLTGRLSDEGYVVYESTSDTIWSIESIEVAGFFNEWPWRDFPPEHVCNDAGLNGDETAGDNVWSRTILMEAGEARELFYKYGANSLDVEAGYEANHVVMLDESVDPFVFPIDCWGSPDTLYQDWDCIISGTNEPGRAVAAEYRLSQNYPNPFNPTTVIEFSLPRDVIASLRVFDILGREVSTLMSGRLRAGNHTVSFDASALPSGVYFYRLDAGSFTSTRKMLLLK